MFDLVSDRLAEIARNLDEKMPSLIATQSMVELEAEWKDRIFGRGEMSDGSKIGNYSTEPAYFTKDSFIRVNAFKPQGKKSKESKFKNGNQRQSMYLPGGYSEFRDIQGRENEFVNLKFGGSMERGFRVYKFGNEVLFGNASAVESLKIQGNEDKFGNWTQTSEAEEQNLKNNIADLAVVTAKE